MTKSVTSTLVCAVLASSLPALASAETVTPLFDATPITTAPSPGANIANRFFFDSKTVSLYCQAPGTLYVKTDTGMGYTNPIVDNYMTAGDDLTSICSGGGPINSPIAGSDAKAIAGTHCFNSGSTTPLGADMETIFTSNATAAVNVVQGENVIEFKLWDYGSTYGNTKLVLVDENSICTDNPLFLDVKPQSFPNAVNICGNGVIPIAIPGSAVLPLDGYTVKSVTIGDELLETFGKAGKDNCAFEDVVTSGEDVEGYNPDGYQDFVCHIPAITFREEAVDGSILTVRVTLNDGSKDLVFELEGTLKQTKLNCLQ